MREAGQVFTVFRNPAKLGVFGMQDGKSVAAPDTCGDADDVLFDDKRRRLYVSCGDGSLDIIEAHGGFRRIARVPTVAGARTALFVPGLDRLLLAVRAQRGEPAASLSIVLATAAVTSGFSLARCDRYCVATKRRNRAAPTPSTSVMT